MSAEDPKNADNRQDLPQPEPEKPSVARRWRYFTRRHAILAGLIIAAVAFVLILLAFFLYRLGYVDRYIANQIKRTSLTTASAPRFASFTPTFRRRP